MLFFILCVETRSNFKCPAAIWPWTNKSSYDPRCFNFTKKKPKASNNYGYYCSDFVHYTPENYSTEVRFQPNVYSLWSADSDKEALICMNYEDTRQITKPGYWCADFKWFNPKWESALAQGYLYIDTIICNNWSYYCKNYVIFSPSTSTSTEDPTITSKITREPCQRLRIRVVFALVQTIIE